MPKYNGHKNYNAWNIALWLSNDEGLYRLACHCVKNTSNKDEAVSKLMDCLPIQTPDGVKYTKTNVRLALVDWG